MKYILSFFAVCVIVVCVFFCKEKKDVNEDYLRIHISANSSSQQDQNLKYLVKDAVVEFLIPKLSQVKTKQEAEEIIIKNISKIEEVTNAVLKSENVNYKASVSIKYEEMPARAYENLVLDEGVYESLNIVLGEGNGDNWWCVVFPAVCFINSNNFQNIEYISKIWDIINHVT